jgi:hypothetical protein
MVGLSSPHADHSAFIAPGPQRDTEAPPWFDSLVLFIGVMFLLCILVHFDFLLLDEARCVLFILIGSFCWHASKFETRNPQLAHFTVHVSPHHRSGRLRSSPQGLPTRVNIISGDASVAG